MAQSFLSQLCCARDEWRAENILETDDWPSEKQKVSNQWGLGGGTGNPGIAGLGSLA